MKGGLHGMVLSLEGLFWISTVRLTDWYVKKTLIANNRGII